MVTNIMKSKAEEMETRELANGAVTVEYVIIVLVIVGLGAALFTFQDQIKGFLNKANASLKALFTDLSKDAYSASAGGQG